MSCRRVPSPPRKIPQHMETAGVKGLIGGPQPTGVGRREFGGKGGVAVQGSMPPPQPSLQGGATAPPAGAGGPSEHLSGVREVVGVQHSLDAAPPGPAPPAAAPACPAPRRAPRCRCPPLPAPACGTGGSGDGTGPSVPLSPSIPPGASPSPPAQALGEGVDALGLSRLLGVEDEEAVEVAVTHVSHHGACGATGQVGYGGEDGGPPTEAPRPRGPWPR